MRPNKYDKHVVVITLIVFILSFFLFYPTPIYDMDVFNGRVLSKRTEPVLPYEKPVAIEYPSAIILAPLVCIIWLCFMIFWRELLPVDRHWLMDRFRFYWSKYKKK